ncbi:MAG: terminase small subunit [Ignavibacteriae bacterium]|nr:terminase small subunit [Ignavibacteriota bacterium]
MDPVHLKPSHKKFADTYLETSNGTKAAYEAFNVTNDNSAAVNASRALRYDKVQEYIQSQAEGAASRVTELSQKAKNEAVKLNANKDILDRAGHKPVDKTLNVNAEVVPTINPELLKLKEEYEEKLRGFYAQYEPT